MNNYNDNCAEHEEIDETAKEKIKTNNTGHSPNLRHKKIV
jgi:hypothetical protein